MKRELNLPLLCKCNKVTCGEVDQLILKGNSDCLGEQEDGAAGLGVQVQIEFHHV